MLPDATMQVLIRRSKADPFGQGRLVFTSKRTAEIINSWRDQRVMDTSTCSVRFTRENQ